METITFEELKKRVGIGLAIKICEKILPEVFFAKLTLDDWLDIAETVAPESELGQRASTIIRQHLRVEVISPEVGTFFSAGTKIGDHVNPGTVVGKVEAMMAQTEITAGISGEITTVLVEDGQIVKYNQALFMVKSDL